MALDSLNITFHVLQLGEKNRQIVFNPSSISVDLQASELKCNYKYTDTLNGGFLTLVLL
jgi:hypothetical protein